MSYNISVNCVCIIPRGPRMYFTIEIVQGSYFDYRLAVPTAIYLATSTARGLKAKSRCWR